MSILAANRTWTATRVAASTAKSFTYGDDTFTAKFSGRCPLCHQYVTKGRTRLKSLSRPMRMQAVQDVYGAWISSVTCQMFSGANGGYPGDRYKTYNFGHAACVDRFETKGL